MNLLKKLWRDRRGEVTASATILLYSVLAIGAITGLVVLRNQIVQEFGDLAVAMRNLDQSFHVFLCGGEREWPGPGETQDSLEDEPGEPPAGIEFPDLSPTYVEGEDAGP
jgi:hypothetical protein